MDASTPQDAVRIFANLDQTGRIPTEGHHVAHRSTAPQLRRDLRNYRGASASLHVAHHRDGVKIGEPADLTTIWNG